MTQRKPVPVADLSAWLHAHVDKLRAQVDELTQRAMGKGAKAKEASDAADRIERRLSRLLRAAASLDAAVKKQDTAARRLAKSKSPHDQAELLVGALDELPAPMALAVAEEALRRARARSGVEA